MVLPSSILLPLYIYPVIQSGRVTTDTWTFLFNAISSSPTLLFNIIVNENSGPGVLSANGCTEDTNYLAGIANLTAFSNTKLLGYVHTSDATRAIADVEADITTWNDYSKCPTVDSKINGIFFDEAPESFTTSTSAYMSQISSFTRTTFGSPSTVIFNPGTIADSRFFALADNIVMFEDTGSNSLDITTIIDSIPAAERATSSIIFNEWAALTEANQLTVVEQIVDAGIESLFITTTGYDENPSALWADFVDAMISAQ